MQAFMLQSLPKKPALHLQLKLFKSHKPFAEQPFGQVFVLQSSPVHSASQRHFPFWHIPLPLQEFKQLFCEQLSPLKPGLQ